MTENNKTPWTLGYKEIKNFIHNEQGITREHMNEIITKIVREEVSESIGRNGEFIKLAIKEIIREEMAYAINDGKYPRVKSNIWDYSEENEFKKFISDILKEEIIKTLREQFEVQLDINKK